MLRNPKCRMFRRLKALVLIGIVQKGRSGAEVYADAKAQSLNAEQLRRLKWSKAPCEQNGQLAAKHVQQTRQQADSCGCVKKW